MNQLKLTNKGARIMKNLFESNIKEILKSKEGKHLNSFSFSMDGDQVVQCHLGFPILSKVTENHAVLMNSVEEFKLDFDKIEELHFEIDNVEIIALYTPDYEDERFLIFEDKKVSVKLFEEEWVDLLLNEFPFDDVEEF